MCGLIVNGFGDNVEGETQAIAPFSYNRKAIQLVKYTQFFLLSSVRSGLSHTASWIQVLWWTLGKGGVEEKTIPLTWFRVSLFCVWSAPNLNYTYLNNYRVVFNWLNASADVTKCSEGVFHIFVSVNSMMSHFFSGVIVKKIVSRMEH